jgi:hypothetical protein
LICQVSAAIIRRYIGLITSLIELRADIRSAEWAGGLKKRCGDPPLTRWCTGRP